MKVRKSGNHRVWNAALDDYPAGFSTITLPHKGNAGLERSIGNKVDGDQGKVIQLVWEGLLSLPAPVLECMMGDIS